MRYVVGIDAGGTKTVGLLADESGRVCAEARGGGANLHVHGELGVEKVLHEVIAALDAPGTVVAICLGMAGVDRPEEKEVIHGVLRRLGHGWEVRLENDAFIALVAGTPGASVAGEPKGSVAGGPKGRGIVVISGTGSVAYGVASDGRVARSGGWGHLLGDEGSAYWLGHAALRRAIRAADGRGPETSLVDRLAEKLDLEVPAGLVWWFYDQKLFRYRVAELAPMVEEAATDGDAAAEKLLEEAAQHLARAARAVARKLAFSEPYPVVLAGGAFRACPSLERRLKDCLDLPPARVTRLEKEPATGAVTLALDRLVRPRIDEERTKLL